uniref:F-box domain-containing protein n=1 Tax=Steinernema glaseri TaxID=37863 RepID=A0A1I8APL6_9BILA
MALYTAVLSRNNGLIKEWSYRHPKWTAWIICETSHIGAAQIQSPIHSYLLSRTMDALPAELVAPIVDLVHPKSLDNLKEIFHVDSQWSRSVDHAQASRFDLSVFVKYLIGSDRMQLYLEKKFLNAPEWTVWAPQDDDNSKIETLSLIVSQIEPGMENLQIPRALCYSWVTKALRLMNASRRLVITVEQLDEYPGDLLDLLPRKRDSLRVSVNTGKCHILPPFDIPIRLHLPPFVGRYRTEHLKRLRGRKCLRWLVDYWKTYIAQYRDWDIFIPMSDGDIWERELKDFTHKAHRRYYYDVKTRRGKNYVLDVWYRNDENVVHVKTRKNTQEESSGEYCAIL